MFAVASSFCVTTAVPAGGPGAKGLAPTLLDSAVPRRSALGAWPTQSNARAWQRSAVTSLV